MEPALAMRRTTGHTTPAGRRHIIERPRLTRLLDEATAKVITLVAPAGYGKTTLARQWLANRPHVWYAASAASADVGALGLGLLRAAEDIAPSGGERFREWLHTRRGTGEPSLAADLLTDDLAAIPNSAWLVVDDYQWLTAPAEQVIGRLGLAGFRLLVTSRRRPAWSTARALLYGEAYELGPTALAMTDKEATEVLDGFADGPAQNLIAVAKGWPAVISLASFAGQTVALDRSVLPPALHAYIADELLASVEPSSRVKLAQLALIPTPSVPLVRRLLGPQGDHVLQEGLRVGLLLEEPEGMFSLHPLLRTFLRRKLKDVSADDRQDLVALVVQLLIAERLWEEAFEVMQEFETTHLLDALIESCLFDLLDQGLSPTVTRLVEFGRAKGLESALLDVGEAELVFREGFNERARALVDVAVPKLERQPSIASKALCLAGHCAYFSDELDAASKYFQAARDRAEAQADKRRAVWGLFLCAVEREDDDAAALLTTFEEISGATADDLARVQNGRLIVGMRLGNLRRSLSGAEAMGRVVAKARDPFVRTSFWHVYGGALRLAGSYEEASDACRNAFAEIETFDLKFARVHVQLTLAAINAGVARYEEALALLDEIGHIGRRHGDIFLQMSERTLRCRVYLNTGELDQAARVTNMALPHIASSGQYAEFLACRALVVGKLRLPNGNPLEVLSQAERLSNENEATFLCNCVRALLAIDHDCELAASVIENGFRAAAHKGVLDPFVFAFRCDHRLAPLVRSAVELRPALDDVVAILSRPPVNAMAETGAPQEFERAANLTKREREVLELVAKGLTNKEIGTILFLTPATAKLHVRHILRKLGLRSRTEAAIYAVKMQRPEV